VDSPLVFMTTFLTCAVVAGVGLMFLERTRLIGLLLAAGAVVTAFVWVLAVWFLMSFQKAVPV